MNNKLTIERLPLAIYLEIAAHLRQIKGIETKLIQQPTYLESKPKFDYLQSQIQCLQIEYPDNLDTSCQQTMKEILDYYAKRYGSVQTQT
jgi:trehalose-6-phosphate synthase